MQERGCHTFFHMRDLVQQRNLSSSSASQHFDSTAAIFAVLITPIKSNKKPYSALLRLERKRRVGSIQCKGTEIRYHESFLCAVGGFIQPGTPLLFGFCVVCSIFSLLQLSCCYMVMACLWRSWRSFSMTPMTPPLRRRSRTRRMPSRLLLSWSMVLVEARLSMLR